MRQKNDGPDTPVKTEPALQMNQTEEGYTPKKHSRVWTKAVAMLTLFALVIGLFISTPWINSLPEFNPPTVPPVSITSPIEAKQPASYHDIYVAVQALAERQENLYRDEGMAFGFADSMKRNAGVEMEAAEPTASLGGAAAYSVSNQSHGKTNVQVEGVDEADIVKNDGRYLYVLHNVSSETEYAQYLSIVELSSMQLLSRTKLGQGGYVSELYVVGDRLVTVGYRETPLRAPKPPVVDDSSIGGGVEDIAAEDRMYDYRDTNNTCAVVYDLGDRKSIKQVREFSQDGGYLSSRMVGDNLYLISTTYLYCRVGMKEEELVDYLPHTLDNFSNGKSRPVPPDCISMTREPDNVFTVVSGLNVASNEPASTQTVLGSYSGVVYSTPSNLYITGGGYEVKTELMRYTLAGGIVSYDRKVEIPGTVKDQFALDEYNGHLRVATTSNVNDNNAEVWEDWTEGMRNNLYVLDGDMNIVGKVEDLAKGETIQSVRYMGEMAYIVTFRQTDPLFAIDVSDPANPTVLGQLKIPGFSSYMHPVDENTLLGIGYDANEESGGTTGLKLSLFDVTNPLEPKETHKLVFSGECDSAATHNHKAVTYIPEKGLLAIPFSVWNTVRVDGTKIPVDKNGSALLISVDKTDGLTLKAILSDPKRNGNEQLSWEEEQGGYEREIYRITYAGDFLYTVSNRSVIRFVRDTVERMEQLDLE